mgnify:CR=1 FL=1
MFTQKERMKKAMETAEWAVQSGKWTNETALQFAERCQNNQVDDETLDFFHKEAKKAKGDMS